MNESHWEEEQLGKAYDARLMRRLLRYINPYKGLFSLAIGLVLAVAAFDLSLPFITKTAIDQFIIPPYKIVTADETGLTNDALVARFSAVRVSGQKYLINVNRLDGVLRQDWQSQGVLSQENYVYLPPFAPPALEALAAAHKDVFSALAGGGYVAKAKTLSVLSLEDRLRLRQEDLSGVSQLALLFFAFLVLRLVFGFAQVYVLQYTGQRVMYDMRQEIFSHLLRLPARFFDQNPVGRLVTRATNDVSAINEMYTAVLVNLFRDVFLIVGILAIMFTLNWRLTGMILLLAPVLVTLAIVFRRYARKAYRQVRLRIAMLNAFLQENISGMRIIQLFAQEQNSFKRFSEINDAKYKAEMRQTLTFAVFNPLIHMMSSVAVAGIIWFGGGQTLAGALSLGALVAFISYIRMLFQPINDLSEKYNILQGAMASSERIFQLLQESQEDRGQAQTPARVQGRIQFKHVWFAYKPEEWVLEDVSFTVQAGQSLAIVGATGSGKTTIISLLQRLYDIQRGQILLDGTDIRQWRLDDLRAQMAVVLQDVFLFSGDIEGNIKLQAKHISTQSVRDAASFVHADAFIQNLNGGYHAEVTERGSTLSAGQRQLLAFARAVAFDPKVLILDEATANIDSQTEVLIQNSLKKILKGRTSILIAHRLSTIRDADQILVLSQGRVVERGTHQQLLEQKGLYAALYELQFANAA